jgi:hypothetical protein
MNKLKTMSVKQNSKESPKGTPKGSPSATPAGSQNNLTKNPPLPKRVPTDKHLEVILKNPKLTDALEEFLKQEFCVENLAFIKDIKGYHELVRKADFQSEKDIKGLEELRQSILKAYLLSSSEMEINIPDKMKRDCVQAINDLKQMSSTNDEFQNLTVHLFDDAERHVRTMLVQDRIGKFQETTEYKAIVE